MTKTAAILTAALLTGACTTILGNDFEIGATSGGGDAVGGSAGPGGAGGVMSGSGAGGAATGGSASGGSASGGSDLCGNDELDTGETCDGDCPTACIDGDLCTDDALSGSPDTCDAACRFETVNTCVDNDGCCPNGCYNSIDNDCDLRLTVVSAFANGLSALRGALTATGEFGIVDAVDAASATPTLSELAGYDAVLVSTNYDGFQNPTALGNVLADFHDQGGRVVVVNGANCTPYALAGRFVDEGYLVLGIGALYPTDDPLGAIDVPGTPLMAGSTGFVAFGHCAGQPVGDAVVVARYAMSDHPVVAYGWVQNRRRVDLNVFPPPDSGAEGLALVVNALKFQ